MARKYFLIGAALCSVAAVGIAGSSHLLPNLALASARSVSGSAITISSVDELQKILPELAARNTPSVIKLKEGSYPQIRIRAIKSRAPITITSENPSNPATIGTLFMQGSDNIGFSDLLFQAANDQTGFPFLARSVSNLTFERVRFLGRLNQADAPPKETALFVRSSNNVIIRDCDFSNSRHALQIQNIDNLLIRNNYIHDIQIDGIRGGGITNAVIEGNSFTNFYPKEGDHPDAIQIWSIHQKLPGRNIKVRNNLIVRGTGKVMQGIFIHDNSKALPFEDVEITGNMLIGTMYNGITISSGNRILINDNDVMAMPDMKSWIRIQYSQNVKLTNNRSTQYLIRQEGGVEKSNNKETGFPSKKKIEKSLNEWKHKNKDYVFHISGSL